MTKHFNRWVWIFLFFGGFSSLSLGEIAKLDIGDPPASKVWDYDGLFRHEAEVKQEISEILMSLEKDHKMEIFLVLYSNLIGEHPSSLAFRCQEKWLGEKDEGFVIVLSLNGGTAGVIGRSRPLYEGHYLEDGVMPRIPDVELQRSIQSGIERLPDADGQVERAKFFTEGVLVEIRKRLDTYEADKNGFSYAQFMGWIAVALIGCAILIGFLSKLLGTADRRTRMRYFFPEFTVPQRLRAPNGGGKISAIDFGSPSSDA